MDAKTQDDDTKREEKEPSTKEIIQQLVRYITEDMSIRKGFLDYNEKKLKNQRIKTYGMFVLFGIPLLFWALAWLNIISSSIIGEDYASLVKLSGIISAGKPASANKLVPAIDAAFEDSDSKAVVILINSPGGSPVQSDLICNAINKNKVKHNKKVYAVAEDYLTSGAYWVSLCADEIYVNKNTMTGSIGVVSAGFGINLEKYAYKYGIERRVTTAGENKAQGDQFSPLTKRDKEKMQKLADSIHESFKNHVIKNRGGKLKGEKQKLFSGDYWLGDEAVELGLVDGVSDLHTVLNEKIGVRKYSDHTPRVNFLENMSNSVSVESLIKSLMDVMTEKQTLNLLH